MCYLSKHLNGSALQYVLSKFAQLILHLHMKTSKEKLYFDASKIYLLFRVREASMSGLETLTRFVAESDSSLLTPEM